MGDDQIALVQAAVELFNARSEPDALDRAAAIAGRFSPDLVVRPGFGAVDGSVELHGFEAWARYLLTFDGELSAFEHLDARLYDLGGVIACELRTRMRGLASGAELVERWVQVWRFRGDLVVEVTDVMDADAGLESLGLKAGSDMVAIEIDLARNPC